MNRPKHRWLLVGTIWAAALVASDYRVFEAAGWILLVVVVLEVGFEYNSARNA